MADGAQWISAVAGCVSACTAIAAFYFSRQDKQARTERQTTPPLPVTNKPPLNVKLDPLVSSTLATIRGGNVAHDRTFKTTPLRVFGPLLGVAVLAAIVQTWAMADYAFLLVPIDCIVIFMIGNYLLKSIDKKLKQGLTDTNKQVAKLIQEPQFTLASAQQLRRALKREARPWAVVDIDDILFEEFRRRENVEAGKLYQ